jgi:hypothetical protein
MQDVARLLNLLSSKTVAAKKKTKKTVPKNKRELEAERKKIRKELDKLMKSHGKATKALDVFMTEKSEQKNPVEDEYLHENGTLRPEHLLKVLTNTETNKFPGLPSSCTKEVLLVWDFLCTFNRLLHLEPIGLEDFVSALTHRPTLGEAHRDQLSSYSPLYLAEAHLSLLKLLVSDQSSDNWWWSTLETPETEAMEKSGKGEADNIPPTIKVDLGLLLDFQEEPKVTRKWLQALEDVRTKRVNAGGSIKSAVKSAISMTTNPLVKTYLHKAMRGWKSNAAAFTKNSVMWLLGRFREARPDVWGREMSKELIDEQKSKVVREALSAMEDLDDEPEIENVDEMHYGDSDDEESDSDDDDNSANGDDEFEKKRQGAKRGTAEKTKAEDESAPATSPVPLKPLPSLVDLLLPPYKPYINSELISPFTWPLLAGVSICRILHRQRRLRNEVDDQLREFRDLPPLTIAERRKREKAAAFRIYSECACIKEQDIENPIDFASEHLCKGGEYLELSPIQRLCILRVLVEAAYDTNQVNQHVQENIKARITAEKQLESEKKRAKKETKEEYVVVEAAARERLAKEARNDFISTKKREIARKNKYTKEFTAEYIRDLTEDEVADFDEETKTEFEGLPKPSQFSKTEVSAMVASINEQTAFGTDELEVLTLNEIENRESSILAEMEEELASYSNNDFDRETSAKIDTLKKEIENFKDWQLTLPPSRSEAIDALKDAIDDGTVKALKAAIKTAKLAILTDTDEDSGIMWTLDLLRDAHLELKRAEQRKRVIEAQKALVMKRNKCFVRTEQIGKDRMFNKYWQFDYDENLSLWFETEFQIQTKQEKSLDHSIDTNPLEININEAIIGAKDEEMDIVRPELLGKVEYDQFLSFSRKEYHPSGEHSTLVKRYCWYLSNMDSLRSLVKNLDVRGLREGSLKEVIKEIIELTPGVGTAEVDTNDEHDLEMSTVASNLFSDSGDEIDFHRAKTPFLNTSDTNVISSTQSAIGQRCRYRVVHDPILSPESAQYLIGTVTGWMIKTEEKAQEGELENSTDVVTETFPIWQLSLDHGGTKEMKAGELIDSLLRYHKWKESVPGYVENDSPLFSYRNKSGRHCGRAADAPYSCSSLFLARLIIKREQEYYSRLKNRTYDNNWGGKSGARNAWIASMKEYGNAFHTVRDGLLTLESAFFELCGGFVKNEQENEIPLDNIKLSGRELLDDDAHRVEIELESIGQEIKGLWNSEGSRNIFLEMMKSK